MGGSYWSDDLYRDVQEVKKQTNTPTFKYDHDVKTGKVAAKAHDALNPKGVIRESRDSAAHPESTAIAFLFDVTGSMGGVPVQLQGQLPKLMGLLNAGVIKDPQILFGAIGDYHSDRVPFQIGQFESGVEMDQDLTRIYIEGNGGGQNCESYNLGLYFAARHTSTDCFEKRQKKGYLFLTGDEHMHTPTTRKEILDVFGDGVEVDYSAADLVKMAQEKFHVFFIIPTAANHGREPSLRQHWVNLLGEDHVLLLDEVDHICEVVGGAIGLVEGTKQPVEVPDVLRALEPLRKTVAISRVEKTKAPAATSKAKSVERL